MPTRRVYLKNTNRYLIMMNLSRSTKHSTFLSNVESSINQPAKTIKYKT